MITETNAEIVNSILQQVVQSGTGMRAQLPDGRPVAGKTGTTENYGDAWFVGYTPQLVVAVWVGYPDRLVPMLTQFHGDAVAGGTYPALIWKAFMEQALPYLKDAPQSFPSANVPGATYRRLVLRDGTFQLDNGLCRNTIQVAYFDGRLPTKTANCKPNEVEVPNVVGETYDAAQARLAAQPLTPVVVYKPAAAGQRAPRRRQAVPAEGAAVVIRQGDDRVREAAARRDPQRGRADGRQGARARLERLKLVPAVRGRRASVVRQRPRSRAGSGAGAAGHALGRARG